MAHPNPMPMPVKVPAGKEDEYTEDERTGTLTHFGYGTDPEMKGTVLPTARLIQVGKHSCQSLAETGFDANAPTIQQNIVDTTKGHEIAEQITRGEMIQQQRGQPQVKQAAGPTVTLSPVVLQLIASAEAEGLMGTKPAVKKAKKKAKKPTKRKGRRAAPPQSSAVPPPQKLREEEATPAWEPAMVQITRDGFGTITQPFAGIFRDGMCLVLVTNNAVQQAVYTLPEITDDPIMLKIGWAGQQLDAVWAGIRFTLPNGSVTFTVLLIPEDLQDEQGREGQFGPQLL